MARTTPAGFVDLQTIKSKFFNKEMAKRIGKGKAKLLSQFGAYTRRAARSSMKKAPKNPKSMYGTTGVYRRGKKQGQTYQRRGKYASPGKPPHYRSDEPNMRTILFGIEDANTVIIGPIWLPASRKMSRPVPNVHEKGGSVTRRYKRRGGSRTQRLRRRQRASSARYPKRPFMLPAGKKGIGDLQRKAGKFLR